MNVSDLSSALHEEADELDVAGVAPQLPRVHSRVQTARRRRRTTVVAISAVAIGAATTLALALPDRLERDPAPVAPVHHPAYDPPIFPAQVGSYHLVTSQVGEPGDSHISLTAQKPTGRFAIMPACSGPKGELDTKLVVNGTSPGGISCSPHRQLTDPGWSMKDLKGSGVDLEPKSMTISLTLVRGRFTQERTSDPGTVLGLAVYQRDHQG
jgi:hypothetical protein